MRRFQLHQIAVVGAWSLAVAAGFVMLLDYKSTPGTAGDAPADWPASTHLLRNARQATLVVVMHPQCPCSAATLEQLDRVLTNSPSPVGTHVLLYKPKNAAADWCDTNVGRRALSLPAVQVLADTDGMEAQLFGVRTSGHVLLFHADGRLVFSGGITASRGHVGDNAACDALLALLNGKSTDPVNAPVFGCPFDNDGNAEKGIEP